jgi:WD40 repeat protein
MRAKTIQIIWHDKLSIFSVDFHPRNPTQFVTCGGDCNLNLWKIAANDAVENIATLSRHASNVNCARFNRNGDIASGGDDGSCLIWKLVGEEYKALKLLRTNSEIFDLGWSRSCSLLVCGSMDGYVRMFDVEKRILMLITRKLCTSTSLPFFVCARHRCASEIAFDCFCVL